jgi:hypothetical protein
VTLTQHVAFTAVAAVLLSPVLEARELAAFAVGSVLIDVDHYLLYVQRRRSLSVKGMFRYFEELQPIQRSIPYIGVCAFHTIDFFVLLAVLSRFYPIFYSLLCGCLYHFVLDLIHLRRKKVLFIRSYFLIEHFIRRRAKGYPWY